VCVCRNLPAAVGAFYDHYSQEGGALPGVSLVTRLVEYGGDLDLREPVPGGTIVTETWTLRNTGEDVGEQGIVVVYYLLVVVIVVRVHSLAFGCVPVAEGGA